MQPDLWILYELMFKSRLFEQAAIRLWKEGKISGEMHVNMGEEAIMAGIVSQLQDGDAMALDHRGTAPLLMRGVNPILLLKEFLGRSDGLCGGMGGHMHLFSPEHLAASSGIVGAAGPTAAGFALAGQMLRPGSVAVAFFGDGATNQGMLMESMNLASAWNLPVLFVCKDNQWAITTKSVTVSGGNLLDRARGFGLRTVAVDGRDVSAVWWAARDALERARLGQGPTFLLASCIRLEGHFLGDPVLDMLRKPAESLRKRAWPLLKALVRRGGASLGERISATRGTLGMIAEGQKGTSRANDPLVRTRGILLREDAKRLQGLEINLQANIRQVAEQAAQV